MNLFYQLEQRRSSGRLRTWLFGAMFVIAPWLASAQTAQEAQPAGQKKNIIVPAPQLAMGAVAGIEPGAAEAQSAFSLGEVLEGRLAGVHVSATDGAPGSGFSVQIRGVRGIRGYNEPLYILDGVPLNPLNRDAGQAYWNDPQDYQATQNTLQNINPNDIARVEVLKDAAATALYGAMGANGVVVITTKMGATAAPEVRVNATFGLSVMARPIDMLGKSDYLAYMGKANPAFTLPYQPGDPVDWQKEATRTALEQNYYISVGGRTERMSYLVSAGLTDQQGVIDRTDLLQGTFRVNLDRQVGKKGLVGFRGAVGYRENNMTMATSPYGTESTVKMMTEALPFAAPDGDGSIFSENPSKWLAGYDDNSIDYSATPSLFFESHLAKGLKFKALAGVDYRNKTRIRWIGNEVLRGAAVNGNAGHSNFNILKYNFDATLNYRFECNRHSLWAMAGGTFYGDNSAQRIHNGTSFFNQDLRGFGISLADTPSPYISIETSSTSLAGFVDAGYCYDERYSIGVSMRAEKSFRYDRGTDDLAWYPSVSASWNLARESWLRGSALVSELKLRGSWGRSGMQMLEPYLLAGSYITAVDPQLDIQNGVNNYYDMRWQNKVEQWNAGIDLGLWDGRLTFTVDAYRSLSHDNLSWYYHKRLGDWNSIYANSAKVQNEGLEFALAGMIFDKKDFRWDADFNIALNRNRINDNGSADGADLFGTSVGSYGAAPLVMNVNRIGQPVSSFWGYKTQGIVQQQHLPFAPPFFGTRLVPGDVKFVDVTGDGNVDANDQTLIGNSNPKYVFGLHSKLNYRNFSLEFLFDGALQFDVVNLARLADTYTSGNFVNLREDTYKKAYPSGDQPRFNAVGVTEVSSRIVEDGSYARLSNLTIGYTVPLKTKWIKALELSVTGKNLFVITDYSGYDPASGSYAYDITRTGIDNGAYPLARTFLFGIRATF